MDPVTPLVCRGHQCDREHECKFNNECLYRSSADEARAFRATLTPHGMKEVKLEAKFCPPLQVKCNGGEAKCSTGGKCDTCAPVSHLERAVVPAKDFAGVIDGAGIKQVMFNAKSPLQLITPEILEGLAGVLLHGAKKYAANNWMRGMSWETVMGGVLRHLTAFRRGEEIDPESGLPHLHHAACGIMFLSWYAHGPQTEMHRKMDDRGYKC